MKISVTVKPSSKKESLTKIAANEYVIKVNAPPIDGRANQRVIELLSEALNKPKSAFNLTHGHKGKKKVFEVK